MASYNRVILVGNLTRDPEMHTAPSGNRVVEIRLATNDRYKNREGEWVDRPMFIDVSVWGNQAEACQKYLSKGRSVLVEGRLRFDSWEKEGQKHSKHSVTADRVQFLSSPGQGQMGQSAGPDAAHATAPAAAPAAAPGTAPAAATGTAPATQPAPPPPDPADEEKDDLPF